MHSLPNKSVPSVTGAWVGVLLFVSLLFRGYILHAETLLGSGLIDPVYGTAYVGGVLTLFIGVLFVRRERYTTETITGCVTAHPVRTLGLGVGTLLAVAMLAVAVFFSLQSLIHLANVLSTAAALAFVLAVVVLAVGVAFACYVAFILLIATVLGYLAVGRALVGVYGWPPAIIAAAVLTNAIAFVPLASLVVDLLLGAAALGGFFLMTLNAEASYPLTPKLQPPTS